MDRFTFYLFRLIRLQLRPANKAWPHTSTPGPKSMPNIRVRQRLRNYSGARNQPCDSAPLRGVKLSFQVKRNLHLHALASSTQKPFVPAKRAVAATSSVPAWTRSWAVGTGMEELDGELPYLQQCFHGSS